MSTANSSARAERALPLPALVDVRVIQGPYVFSFVLLHALALLTLVPWFFSWAGVIAFWVGVVVFGQVGIPICYHRQLTHRSFRTPKWLEHTFVLLAMCSAQDTPAKWVAWHRKHHGHSDEREDPHTPLVNFFWSHVGSSPDSVQAAELLAFISTPHKERLPVYRLG
jgi:stearoyl-CoA desaturase (delta-9 desaturase)